MEYTSSTSLHFPAAYAPISEDEMIYIEGGADVISPQQFTYNLVTNLIRLLVQAAFTGAVTGLINMRNDGLTLGGSIKHYWGRQTPVGKTMTVVAAGFAGVYVYYWARSAIESFLSIYNDMRNIYNESEAKNQAQAAGTVALAA